MKSAAVTAPFVALSIFASVGQRGRSPFGEHQRETVACETPTRSANDVSVRFVSERY